MAFALRDGARLSLFPLTRARSRRGRLRLTLRTAQSLPHYGLLTLHFDAGRFPPTPAACYRAGAVDADTQSHNAQVLTEVDTVDHQRHQVQVPQWRSEQLGQGQSRSSPRTGVRPPTCSSRQTDPLPGDGPVTDAKITRFTAAVGVRVAAGGGGRAARLACPPCHRQRVPARIGSSAAADRTRRRGPVRGCGPSVAFRARLAGP